MPATKRFEPFPKTRFTPQQLKALFTNGKLAQQFFDEDPDGYRAARLEGQAIGIVGENISGHNPAPRVAPAPAPVEEAVYSVAECREIGRGNISKLLKDEPLRYAVYQQSLAAHGLAPHRTLDPQTAERVKNLSNRLRAEKQAGVKSAKLADLAEKQSALDKEKSALITPKKEASKVTEKTPEPTDWQKEFEASKERQRAFDELIADAETKLAHIMLDQQLQEDKKIVNTDNPAKAYRPGENTYLPAEAKDVEKQR